MVPTETSRDLTEPEPTSDEELQELRARLHGQLSELQEAVNVAAASDSCAASSAPSRRQVPLTTFARIQELEFLPLGDHYQQALDQALELYALTDPDASDDVVQTTAMEAAWKDTLAEAL